MTTETAAPSSEVAPYSHRWRDLLRRVSCELATGNSFLAKQLLLGAGFSSIEPLKQAAEQERLSARTAEVAKAETAKAEAEQALALADASLAQAEVVQQHVDRVRAMRGRLEEAFATLPSPDQRREHLARLKQDFADLTVSGACGNDNAWPRLQQVTLKIAETQIALDCADEVSTAMQKRRAELEADIQKLESGESERAFRESLRERFLEPGQKHTAPVS